MTLKYKVGDEVITHGMSSDYTTMRNSVPNGTRTRIKSVLNFGGYYIDDPRSTGWWSECNLLPVDDLKVQTRSGFGRFIRKVENGNK